MRPVTIRDGETSYDLLTVRITKSVQQQLDCPHTRGECLSTSESGSNTCYAQMRCLDCKRIWTDELLPAEYDRLVADESIP